MKTIYRSIPLIAAAIFLFSFDLPEGWFKAGSAPGKYDMGIDKGAGQDGKNAATIKSNTTNVSETDFGTLMQNCLPGKYLGKRIKMSGYLKTNNVKGWAAYWLRVDPNLSFDNMHDGGTDRSISGTSDWKKYEIVLDVPSGATNVAYGVLLSGTGQVWFANMKFEIVDNASPTTGADMKKNGNAEPVNLDFSK